MCSTLNHLEIINHKIKHVVFSNNDMTQNDEPRTLLGSIDWQKLFKKLKFHLVKTFDDKLFQSLKFAAINY